MGLKCKNYVPVGRRGINQGVVLNMHLHWKKHRTLQVVVRTFSPEEVKDIASELARLTGGIVLGIHEYTIIIYRGKNYSQPPTEIMSPRITLSRKKVVLSIGIRGSVGYVAPEYGLGSEISRYRDVYNFDILMLEMFTGKRPTSHMFRDGLNLHIYVKTSLSECVSEISESLFLQEGTDNVTEANRRKQLSVRAQKIEVFDFNTSCRSCMFC